MADRGFGNQRFLQLCEDNGAWYLTSNINDISHIDACSIYKDRLKIEKCFQGLKSSGFNMEKSKIRKYSKYKKLLAISMVAHALLVLLGHLIVIKSPSLLKNSAQMADVILAYFLLEERLTTYLQRGKYSHHQKLNTSLNYGGVRRPTGMDLVFYTSTLFIVGVSYGFVDHTKKTT